MIAKNALTEFGLSARQAEIYLVLRKFGPLNVTEIGRHTGIPRVSIYSSLEELQRHGIVGRLKKNRRQLFEAQAPSLLLQLLKRKSELFESALPLLQALGPAVAEGFSARLYEGYEQARQAQRDFYEKLAEDKVKLVQSISHPDLAKKFPRFVPLMIERRKKMGISTRLIVSDTQRKKVPPFFGGEGDREMRFLPGEFPFNCTCLVGGNTTLFIITQHAEPVALLVNSKSVSGMIGACFGFIWGELGK